MNSRRLLLILSVILFSASVAKGQFKEEKPPLRDRMFFGGNFWMSFGTVTDIEISPLLGFFVSPRLAVAGGIKYRFYRYKNDPVLPDGSHIYGFNVFTRYYIIPDMSEWIKGLNLSVFTHAEYEGLSLDNYYDATSTTYTPGRFWINSVLVGGGISQRIGQRSAINLMLLYNLNESANSLESNPVIRVGFSF